MAAAAQLLLFDAPSRTAAPTRPAHELSPTPARTVAPACSPHELSPTPEPVSARAVALTCSHRELAPVRRRSQAWLALHFAELSLAAAYNATPLDRRATLDTSAWAVIDDDRLKHVVACDERAWHHGVRPGHRMNAAIALCGSLTLISRDATAETRLLERIASECLKYTSAVSMQPPNEVLLEVRGSFRLFGGPAALMERIRADLSGLNAGLQCALAPTARGSQWLARASTTRSHGGPAGDRAQPPKPRVCLPRELADTLGSLPIASLQWPMPVELQLTRFGVTTVADLMRLSRKDLARRLGAGPVRELQQAMGRTAWLHHGWSTPPAYHDRVLLDFEIETTALLEKMLERPLARLKRTLIGAVRSIDELLITLKHREGSTPVAIRLQQATADTAHLATLLHEHLDRLVLRAPVREVVIDAPRLLVARPRNQSLAMDPATRSDVPSASELKARLLEQLQSRFGVNAIRALAVRAHHMPERAQCAAAPSQTSTATATPPRLPRRPLWLLREPKPVTREYRQGAFRIESSPETIETEAWEGASVRRAYYRALRQDGVACWIYRDLISPQQWFVHGLFG